MESADLLIAGQRSSCVRFYDQPGQRNYMHPKHPFGVNTGLVMDIVMAFAGP
jgi:hypothetical protein